MRSATKERSWGVSRKASRGRRSPERETVFRFSSSPRPSRAGTSASGRETASQVRTRAKATTTPERASSPASRLRLPAPPRRTPREPAAGEGRLLRSAARLIVTPMRLPRTRRLADLPHQRPPQLLPEALACRFQARPRRRGQPRLDRLQVRFGHGAVLVGVAVAFDVLVVADRLLEVGPRLFQQVGLVGPGGPLGS